MKGRIVFFCLLLGFTAGAFAQGQITFQNRFIETPEGAMYHVPIWIDLNGDGTFESGEGVGSYAATIGQTATLALYLRGALKPLATASFRSDTNGQFLGNPVVQDVLVPGYPAGTTAPLTIKAWIGPDFETATSRGSWDFTSLPLGGAPSNGGPPMIPPTVFGWGNPNGEGYKLTTVPRGQITFQNRLVQAPDGPMYDVPIWIDLNGDGTFEPGEGIGSYAAAFGQTATLGLYLQGGLHPLATALFRSDTNGQFLGNPALQDVFVPGYPAGTTAPLTIKAWVGPDYETAAIRGAWDFTSLPLGGVPSDGSVPMIPPSVAGWGDLNGHGYSLAAPVAPIAGNDVVTRRSFGDARIPIATLLANDSDPAGGVVSFVAVDWLSSDGATLTRVDGDIVYHPAKVAPDFFFYTVRNSAGGMTKGRVDVTIVDPDGLIVFSNRSIPLSNGGSPYNVPIFVDANFDGQMNQGEAMGTFASAIYHQPAKLGLYLRGSDVALATATFRVDSLASFVTTGQIVVIPGAPPGSRVDLTVKAWIGNDFATAKVKGAWDFTSAPLGGFVAGAPPYANPGLTGWGNENGSGYGLAPGAKLIVGTDELVRPYRQDVTTSIATLLANDSDPDGGTLTVTAVDSVSNGGAAVMMSGTTITYYRKTETDDYFTYTVRSTSGVTAIGRVNVKVSEPIGEIVFSNYNIPKAAGGGTYNVPIYVDYNTNGVFDTGEDLGSFAALFGKTARMALYQQGSNQPIATVNLANGCATGGIIWGGGIGVGVGPTGTVVPPTGLTSINVNITNPDSGVGLSSYTVGFSGGSTGTFTIGNGSMGEGTYTYTVDNAAKTAHLRLNYSAQFQGDYDDMTLIFTTQPGGGANNFSGSQQVGGHPYWLSGNFTYAGSSDGIVVFQPGAGILVPGFRPGEQAPLTIKAWVGNDYDSATIKGSWDFTSLPLGGPRAGTNVPVPGLTGWGNENGEGYALEGNGEIPIVDPGTIHIIQGTPISVIRLLPIDPSLGGVAVIRAGPMTDGGNQVVLYDNSLIYFSNTSFVGTDSFSYAVLTSSGAMGGARVNVMIDPCNDCTAGGTTGPGPGTSTSTGTSTGTGTGTTGTTGTGGAGGGSLGKLYVVNQLVRHSGGGTYNVPIWVDANFNGVRDKGEGIGAFASSVFGQKATLGMFVRNGAAPFATVQFKTNVGGAFLQEPGYTEVIVPGFSAGSPVDLTIKAWIGDDYASATLKGAWDFTSLPLGYSGNDAPDLTGWGVETSGKGYAIIPGVKPRVYGQVITRLVGQNVSTTKAAIMQNDSDPDGGALTFVSADEFSKQGAVVTVLGNTIYYVARNQDNDAPDYFDYTVRNAQGGYAKGRVDVVVTDAQGKFNTLLEINYTPQGNEISFRGVIGSNYTVQFRDTVEAGWQDIGPAVHDAFGLFKIVDPNGTNTRFYRVVTQL